MSNPTNVIAAETCEDECNPVDIELPEGGHRTICQVCWATL